MRVLKIFSLLIILSITFGSCEKLLNPENDNHSTIGRVFSDPAFAEGLLMAAYLKLPSNSLTFNDVATDDAVTNSKSNQYHRMAVGQWSALYNPVSQWDNCNAGILSLNNFLSIIDTVPWKWSNDELNSLYIRRFKGEAYALRGLLQYHLLVTVGGKGFDNDLLGIQLHNKFYTADDNFNIPRATFAESVAQIYADLDKALEYFTMDDYKDVSSADQLPSGFEGVNPTNYNAVFGYRANQRISGRIVKALKSRVALLAASPAFSTGDPALWEKAANYAGVVLKSIGGVAGLDPVGHNWYLGTYVDVLKLTTTGADQKEILWRSYRVLSNSRESANFPPSLYGKGNVNPTQNLVDAFPMKNGYPITDAVKSGYNAAKPYNLRDPRMNLYILFNGATFKSTVIKTGFGGGDNAKDSISTSTRTGYYMKKLLREDVNMNPTAVTTKNHYEVHMRYTELFLIYAEAANEAWGPDGKGTWGFSARDVIGAIRKRCGITQPDNYLASISSTADMRTLIRNERRIELCFEGFRFWDLRRWKADLTQSAKGVNINKEGTTFSFVDVEERAYDNEYMHYGPLPQNDVLKYNALVQNKGW